MKIKFAQLATLVVALFSIFTGADAFAGISSPVTLEAFVHKNTAVSETGGTMTTSTIGITTAEAGSINAPNFGCRLRAGSNGTLSLTSVKYTLGINGAVGNDGAGNPILDRQLGAFNAPGNASRPDMRCFNLSGLVTSTNGVATAGSSTAGTERLLLEDHSIAIDGTTRRPFMVNPGDSYSVEYHISGTFNSVPFDLTAVAQIVVLSEAPTPISVSDLQDTQITLNWGNVAGETGFRVESSTDNGSTWQQVSVVPANTLVQIITGLQVQTDYWFRVLALNAGGDSSPSPTLALPKTIPIDVSGGFANFTVRGHGHIQYSSDLVNWSYSAPSGATVTGSAPMRIVSLPWNPPERGFIRVTDIQVPELVQN